MTRRRPRGALLAAAALVTCTSEERGITCENTPTGHGFTISKSLNEIW